MRVNYFPASIVTETPATIILIAESPADRKKLGEIAESMSPIVTGESRCVQTGKTCILEIGVPKNKGQHADEGESDATN